MWKQILSNVNAAILANWSQLVSFVFGALLGIFVLAGLMSCSTIAAVEEGVVSDVYNLGKDGIEVVVDVVTPDEKE